MSRKKNIYKNSEIRFVKNELKKQSKILRSSSKNQSHLIVRKRARLKNGLVGWIRSTLKRAKKRIPTALLQNANIRSLIRYVLKMRKTL